MVFVYLAPYKWITVTGIGEWGFPAEGNLGSLDLRTKEQQDSKGILTGYGIFTYPEAKVIADSVDLGSDLTKRFTKKQKDEIESRGFVASDTLLDFLWDAFTVNSDPTGTTAPKPLMPTRAMNLELFLGGFSKIKSEHFDISTSPYKDKVLAVIHDDYRRNREYFIANDSDHYLKVLGGYKEKYRVSDGSIFIPDDLPVEIAKTPSTTIGDTFDRADNTDLNDVDTGKTLNGGSGTWQWTEAAFDSDIFSNAWRPELDPSAFSFARAEQDLSSDDQRSYIHVNRIGLGQSFIRSCAVLRFNSGNLENYFIQAQWKNGEGTLATKTSSGGSRTGLDSGNLHDIVDGGKVEITIDGSTITLLYDDDQKSQFTDTTHSGNLRGGVAGFTNHPSQDNNRAYDWFFEDLSGGETHDGAASVTGVATVTLATGDVLYIASADVTGIATITTADPGLIKIAEADAAALATTLALAGLILESADASVSGIATITLATGDVLKIGAADVTGVATISATASLNIIYGVPFAPTGEAGTDNMVGDWTDIDEDPFNIDANWITVVTEGDTSFYACDFSDSLQYKAVQGPAKNHSVTVTLRKSSSGGTDPTFIGQLWEDEAAVDTPIVEVVTNITSETFSEDFALDGYTDLSLLKLYLITGNPADRNAELAAARIYLAMEGTRIKASVSGEATVNADGGIRYSGAADVTGVATITNAAGDIGETQAGAADVTGIATVSDATAAVDHQAIASVSGAATVDARASLNIILGVPFAPDGEATNINFSGDYTDIDDDPYDIDGNWLDVIDETDACIYIAELPDSLQHKVVQGVGLHSVAVTVRKNASGGTDPTTSFQMFDGANPREEVIDAETVTSTTSEVHTGTFGLMPVSDYSNLVLLRVLVGGTSSGDRNIDVAAVRIYLAMEGTRIKASVSGAATVTDATGGLKHIGAADVTGVATITTADPNVTYSGEASVTGIATITDATGDIGGVEQGEADVTGIATVTDATAAVEHQASASVTGIATISAAGDVEEIGAASIGWLVSYSIKRWYGHNLRR